MYKIEIEIDEIESASELFKLAESDENIDIITEKNFNGDLTHIELYILLSINVIVAITPIIVALIYCSKNSKLTMDGNRIEVTNVSQDLIKEILMKQLANNESSNNADSQKTDKNVSK